MQVVICFDVDGTLETSSGPVKIDRLTQLQATTGFDIWIVSPSSLSPNRRTTNPTHFTESIKGDRLSNLLAVKQTYAESDTQLDIHENYFWLYVSDNKDYDA